jgi:tetratricopeptide (TPR) repeat protein
MRRFLVVGLVFAVAGHGAFAQSELRKAADDAFTASRWADSSTLYAKVLQASPQDARSWFRYGYALQNDEKYEGAVDAYRHAIDLRFQRMVAQYNIGCAFARLGQADRAYAELERAVDMGYNSTQQFQQDNDLVSLHDSPEFQAILGRTRRPLDHFPAGRDLPVTDGRWVLATGSEGALTANTTARGFAKQIDLVVDRQRVFELVMTFSPAKGGWLVTGSDRDGGLYSGHVETVSGGIVLGGRAEGGSAIRWALTFGGSGTASVKVEDKAGSGWHQRYSYRLRLEP